MENGQTTPQQDASTIVSSEPAQTQPAEQQFFRGMAQENSYEQDGGQTNEVVDQEAPVSEESGASIEAEVSENQAQPDQVQELQSRQLAYMAKRERDLQAREAKLKEMESAVRPDEDDYTNWKKAKELSKYDPMGAIEAMGMNFEDVQKHYADESQPLTKREALLQQKLDDLDKWRNDEMKSREDAKVENEKKAKAGKYQTQVNNYMADLEKTAIEAKNEDGSLKYELVHGEKEYELVYEVTNEHWAKHGKVLSNDEALKKVEDFLEKKTDKMLAYKKFGKYRQAEKTETPDTHDFFAQNQNQSPNQNNTPQTLTSNFAPVNPPNSNQAMTIEESKRKAAEMIEFFDD